MRPYAVCALNVAIVSSNSEKVFCVVFNSAFMLISSFILACSANRAAPATSFCQSFSLTTNSASTAIVVSLFKFFNHYTDSFTVLHVALHLQHDLIFTNGLVSSTSIVARRSTCASGRKLCLFPQATLFLNSFVCAKPTLIVCSACSDTLSDCVICSRTHAPAPTTSLPARIWLHTPSHMRTEVVQLVCVAAVLRTHTA